MRGREEREMIWKAYRMVGMRVGGERNEAVEEEKRVNWMIE